MTVINVIMMSVLSLKWPTGLDFLSEPASCQDRLDLCVSNIELAMVMILGATPFNNSCMITAVPCPILTPVNSVSFSLIHMDEALFCSVVYFCA